MFIALMVVTFALAVVACLVVTRLFARPVQTILQRLVGETLAAAWQRYLTFAIYVVGVSGGVRIWELERYLTPGYAGVGTGVLELTPERWVLESYSTLMQTMQSVAWLLLVFFMVALVAHVIMRGAELRMARHAYADEARPAALETTATSPATVRPPDAGISHAAPGPSGP